MIIAILILAATASGCAGPTGISLEPGCAASSEAECLGSTLCVLTQPVVDSGEYVCRAAANACERAFHQTVDGADVCEARDGCVFEPGRCYCPPGMTCVCGGGPPPQCVSSA